MSENRQLNLPHTLRAHPESLTEAERMETMDFLEREAQKRAAAESKGNRRN